MDSDFKYRLYEAPDLEKMTDPMRTYYDPRHLVKRTEIFKYITTENPYLFNRSPYNLIEVNGKIIGYVGRMPTVFRIIEDKEIQCFYSHDTFIHPDYRGKGIGAKLVKSQAATAGSFLVALWFNAPNHKAYQKAGWTDIQGLRPFHKHMRSDYFLSRRIKNKKIRKVLSLTLDVLLKIIDLKSPKEEVNDVRVEEVDSFDERIDNLFEKASRTYSIIMARRSPLLNWKYVKCLFKTYKKYIAVKDGEVIGYMISRISKEGDILNGTIVDFLVSREDKHAFRALISNALNRFKKEGVHYVSILAPEFHFRKNLSEFGFRASEVFLPFMVTNWEPLCAKEFVTDIKNWFITFGDSDYGMWSIG